MATNKKAIDSSAQPKWVAATAAVIALSGAVYTWFSHFQPKVDSPKLTPVAGSGSAPQNVAASGVSATAPGAIAIGSVGGNVSIGGGAGHPEVAASKARIAK